MAAEDKDLNRDPITDEPGAHPVGTGIGATAGAVAGAVAGAAAGTLGGPVGVAVGGAVGAVVGGLAGKLAAKAVNPTAEEAHWREHHSSEPYYEQGRSFDDYAPAYRLGLAGRARYEGDWESAEPQLASEWESARGGSSLSWPQAQPASRAAWDRIESNRTSGTDRDDVIDVLNELVETCKDGEYGFTACAEQAKRADLKSVFMQRADDCRGAGLELAEQIRGLGGKPKESGGAMGALERGWVAVRAELSTYGDKAILEECERGEDNAVARYRKALKKPLPAGIKLIVERQLRGAQRNHDQIKMLRDQFRASA